jgi:hypothetical protein
VTPDDAKRVVGRSALGDLIYTQWDVLVTAVESLPYRATKDGTEEALKFSRTHLRLLADAVALEGPDTPARAKAMHRVHIALGEGFLRVMVRPDRAGQLSRIAFLEAVEREFVSQSIQAVFRHDRDEHLEEPYRAVVQGE